MNPTPLRLFPSISDSLPHHSNARPLPVKYALQPTIARDKARQLKPSSTAQPRIQPATNTVKHSSLDKAPSTSQDSSVAVSASTTAEATSVSDVTPRRSRISRRLSRTPPPTSREYESPKRTTTRDTPSQLHSAMTRDDASNLPQTLSQPSYRPTNAGRMATKTPISPILEDITSDQLLQRVVPEEFQAHPVFDGSSPSSGHSSGASSTSFGNAEKPPSLDLNAPAPRMRSIFPRYDHSKTLEQQRYYPSQSASSPPAYTHDAEAITQGSSAGHRLKRFDSAVELVDHYEHVPTATNEDLEAVWRLSRDEKFPSQRKMQFKLSTGWNMTLSIGDSAGNPIYTMEEIHAHVRQSHLSRKLSIRKYHACESQSAPVTQLVLPYRTTFAPPGNDTTTVFPQQAAIDAIDAASILSESTGRESRNSTSTMFSDAAILAKDVAMKAQQQYKCELVRQSHRRSHLIAVLASYDLCHPTIGVCTITVTKSQAPASISGPKARISLSHPSATPAAVDDDTMSLAYLDFALDACVIDLPSISALGGRYVLDTFIAALLAVAALENDVLLSESMVFEAPPKVPFNECKIDRKSSSAFSTRKLVKRSSSRQGKREDSGVDEQVDLPVLTEGVMTVVDLSLKAAAIMLGAGVQVTKGLVGKLTQ